MKIVLHGKTRYSGEESDGVFRVILNSANMDTFCLTATESCISASVYYIDDIIDLLTQTKKLVKQL